MIIRLEKNQDWRNVESLTREAFWNVYRPGCSEHYVLNQYRDNPDFIPELDFVMEEDDKIIGHIMFSKAEIILDDGSVFPSWTFGPISIHPDYKRKGYGLKLLNYALDKAKSMGVGLLQMEGNIEFYRHAGFDLASKLHIHYHAEPRESEVPYFLAQELIPGYWGGREGSYCPPKGYFVADDNPDAFEAFDTSFPKKEKLRLAGQLGFEFKEGMGNRGNSRSWKACHDQLYDTYTAEISSGGVGDSSYQLFKITKEIFDQVGSFDDDDNKSERLIKTGTELLRYDDSKYAPSCYVIFDRSYATLCPWIDDWYKNESNLRGKL